MTIPHHVDALSGCLNSFFMLYSQLKISIIDIAPEIIIIAKIAHCSAFFTLVFITFLVFLSIQLIK